MATLTFRVLEGVDKGRTFRGLSVPVTIGREEGNLLRLNDERVSRFHAKVFHDNGDIILTDLESTNGTRVNNNMIQIRRLRPGDQISIGRSLLLFGSNEEIAARLAAVDPGPGPARQGATIPLLGAIPSTIPARVLEAQLAEDIDFDVNLKEQVNAARGTVFMGNRALPPLPQKMSPSQAARLAEMLDFLHRLLTAATENISANDEGTQVTLGLADWQRVLLMQMFLAQYVRAVAEPEAMEGS